MIFALPALSIKGLRPDYIVTMGETHCIKLSSCKYHRYELCFARKTRKLTCRQRPLLIIQAEPMALFVFCICFVNGFQPVVTGLGGAMPLHLFLHVGVVIPGVRNQFISRPTSAEGINGNYLQKLRLENFYLRPTSTRIITAFRQSANITMTKTDKFLQLFDHKNAKLMAKFSFYSNDEKPTVVNIKSRFGQPATLKEREFIKSITNDSRLSGFATFYQQYSGLTMFEPYFPPNVLQAPLLTFVPAAEITPFTRQYLPGGNSAWIIDHNKSKALYRGGDSWIAFAEITNGPAMLAIFINGEHAGKVFYVTPQPHFNILKPVAHSFELLLERIAKEPAAFLRMVRAYIPLAHQDGYNYGYSVISYLPDHEISPDVQD